jgi:hypothetical protein
MISLSYRSTSSTTSIHQARSHSFHQPSSTSSVTAKYDPLLYQLNNHMMFDESRDSPTSFLDFLNYQSVDHSAPPIQPLDFPTPIIHRGRLIRGSVLDHRSNRLYNNDTPILLRLQDAGTSQQSDRAYLVRKKLAKTVYGYARLCIVLRKRFATYDGGHHAGVEWKTTDEIVVVKMSSWKLTHQRRGRHREDPLKG